MVRPFSFGLKTYRCFFQADTAKLHFKPGEVIGLVGANNAGKSTLMRAIYELRIVFESLGNGGWTKDKFGAFKCVNQNVGGRFSSLNDPYELVPMPLFKDDKKIEFEIETEEWILTFSCFGDALESSNQVIRFKSNAAEDIALATTEAIEIGKILCSSIYIGPYRNIANQVNQGAPHYYGLAIGSSFVDEWRSFKTGVNKASKFAVIDTQRCIANLLGYGSLEVNASASSNTLDLVINGDQPLSLGDVGAGISQLIFSVVTVANRAPQLVLIDEPELHLHPAMQTRFVEALHSFAGYSTVFATHSVGLARQVANSVFLISQDKKTGRSSMHALEAARSSALLLGELSYSQFSAIGGRYLLLVEGTTEVKMFRVLLRKLEIDADVMIIPLGGSSLIRPNVNDEMAEFKRIGAQVFVLIDSEKSSEAEPLQEERESFRATCTTLFGAERTFLTKRRATENYLPERAIKAVKGESCRALAPYQKLNELNPAWGKNENWKIANEMRLDEIRDTDLGVFLLLLQSEVQTYKNSVSK